MRTPDGAATARFTGGGHEVQVDAWGAGAAWVVEHAPDLVGACDRVDGFAPDDPYVAELARRHAGLRVARSLSVHPLVVATVIGQRVTGIQAARSWASIVRRFGERAPGPAGLVLPPSPQTTRGAPLLPASSERHRAGARRHDPAGVDRGRRARAAPSTTPAVLDARLRSIPGIGPWTSALVCASAAGDPDAVPVGDLHLPGIICYSLTGDASGGDERMLELLAPYAGHRGRVARLILMGGAAPPRHAPRQRLVPIADL